MFCGEDPESEELDISCVASITEGCCEVLGEITVAKEAGCAEEAGRAEEAGWVEEFGWGREATMTEEVDIVGDDDSWREERGGACPCRGEEFGSGVAEGVVNSGRTVVGRSGVSFDELS